MGDAEQSFVKTEKSCHLCPCRVQPARPEPALLDPQGRSRNSVVTRQLGGRDRDLQQARERPDAASFHASSDERFPAIREHDDIAGLEVQRGVLKEAEVVAGRIGDTSPKSV
jgi:hypothetical protein